MAITKIKSSNIEDGTVANVDIADLDSTKLTGTIATARLSNVDLTTLSATNLTSGTIPDARIPASAVTQHVTSTDLTPLRQDIAMLALYNAVSDNRAAYNLPNSFVDQFEDSTGLTTLTDVNRNVAGEYVASIATTANSPITITAAHQHVGTTAGPAGNATSSAAFDGNTGVDGSNINASEAIVAIDWTVGVTKKLDGFKASSVHANGLNWGGSTVTIYVEGSTDNFSSSIVSLGNTGSVSDTPYVEKLTGITSTTGYRYHRLRWATSSDSRCSEVLLYELLSSANATGTLISDQQTAPALTKMSGVVLVKDGGSSTTVMGTHLKIYFCATGAAASFPSAWVEADSYTAVTAPFSTGVTMYKLGETTVPSGTNPTIRAVWASQTSGGFESQLHGWAMNY